MLCFAWTIPGTCAAVTVERLADYHDVASILSTLSSADFILANCPVWSPSRRGRTIKSRSPHLKRSNVPLNPATPKRSELEGWRSALSLLSVLRVPSRHVSRRSPKLRSCCRSHEDSRMNGADEDGDGDDDVAAVLMAIP